MGMGNAFVGHRRVGIERYNAIIAGARLGLAHLGQIQADLEGPQSLILEDDVIGGHR